MRTTLKGKFRRSLATAPSGSEGESVGDTDSRIGPLSKLQHYQGRKRRSFRTAGKGMLWLVASVLVATGGLAGGVWLFLEDSIEAVRPSSEDVIEAKSELVEVTADDPTAPAVALVIGYDAREGFTKSRSDTVMLLRVDPARNTMTVLSFPRDLSVFHPGCKKRREWVGKINEAYFECGAVGTLRTVQRLTGVKVNFLVTLNFAAFKQMVAKAGGVYLDVDQRYINKKTGPGGYASIDIRPGYQKLSGQKALDYARYRHNDSDILRTLRQQLFLKAFKQQVTNTISVTSLPGFVGALRDNVEIQKGGKDIDSETVLKYAKFLYSLPDGGQHQIKIDLSRLSVNNTTGNLSLPKSLIAELVSEFQNPDTEVSGKAADLAIGKRRPVPKPGNTTIEVFNGNAVEGSAADAAERLRKRGYVAESIGDANNFSYFDTVVQYNPNMGRSKAAAEKIAELFDGVVEEASGDSEFGTMLRIIVGKTYHNSIAPGARDQTPKKTAPRTSPSLTEVKSRLVQAGRRAGFQAYAPGLKAAGSLLALRDPVRAYKLGKYRAITWQFAINRLWYYGFMQTSWIDPPILRQPSQERKYKGRTYQLFFTGPRLQMVSFIENDMAFWVRNTLDQQLTNETMLELAHGFRQPAEPGS